MRHRSTRRSLGCLLGLGLATAACGSERDPKVDAAAAFARFQMALQAGDEPSCRELLTQESAPALAQMPWDAVRKKQPLLVLGASGEGAEFRVHVADPNQGGAESDFVVVREYGRLVVDLIATAGLHTETVETAEASGSRGELAPRPLTPADMERIRQYELSQPPK